MKKHLLSLSVVVLAVLFVSSPAGAAITGITAAAWDVAVADPVDDDANLASITAGATTYTVLTGATSAAVVGPTGTLDGVPTIPLLYGENATAPASGLAAVTDGLNSTTGVVNIKDGVNFFFGQNVDGGEDDVLVRPIDGAGNLIGDFSLNALSGGGLGAQFAAFDAFGLNSNGLNGVVFNTSDFTGTGALSGVVGIRLASDTFDVMTVGIAAVPEPSTLALVFLGMIASARRKACCHRRTS